ncbi:MAG: autotransporter-associated beta strand repeat-containing protein, partial [Candidatus Omnitrophota bacterium]
MHTHKKIFNNVKTLCLLLGLGITFSFTSVYADPFTVTNYDSSGSGSLSTAIDALNTSATSGTIEFNESSSSGTIDLAGYTTSLGYETIFDLNNYNVTLENYVGGCTSWTKFDGATTGVLNIGSGSTWTNTWGLVVGDSGTGALTVSGGGNFSVLNGGTYIAPDYYGVGTLTVTGTGSTYTEANDIIIGTDGSGELDIYNGGAVSDVNAYIGYDATSTAVVNVDGSGSTWTNSGNMTVGHYSYGDSILNVTNGGMVNDADGIIAADSTATGVVNVTGSGSAWNNSRELYVGYSGTGEMTISDGGTVSAWMGGYIGYNRESTGTVTVDGAGSTLTSVGALGIGLRGRGELTILNGGAVRLNSEAIIGWYAGSSGTVTVTGSGSTLAPTSTSLAVGYGGDGTLTVSDGGVVSSTYGYIGLESGSSGTMEVTGAGSVWANTSYMRVGDYGDGTLTVSDGGTVNVGSISLGRESGSCGILNIGDGGTAGTTSAVEINGGSGTATVNFNLSDEDYTFGSNLTGSLALTKSGAGVVNLTGTNTYTSGTSINAGAIDAKTDNALGTGDITINDGGCLLLGTGGDESGTLVLSNNISVEGDGNTGIGAINNADGTSTLSGAVTTTADTTIGSISGSLLLTNSITSAGNYNLTFTGEGDVGVEGAIGMGSGSVIKNGTGALILSGTNTYTGGTSINAGGVVAISSGAFGSGDVTIADEATLVLDGSDGDVIIANNITSVQGIGPAIFGAIVSAEGDNTISGSIALSGDTTIHSDNNSLTLSGVVSGAHALTLKGDGIINLSGANTYTGATAVNAGTVNAGIADQAFGIGSDVTVGEGATLSLNNFNETIGSLSGSGTVKNGGIENMTLTVGDGSTTFSGLITDGGAGKFALTKDGTGILVLTGANTYSGTTTINNGALQVNNSRSLGNGAVTNNSELDIGLTNLTFDGVYTQAAGSTLKLSAASAASYGSIVSSSDAVVSSASSISVKLGGYLPNRVSLKVIDGAGGAGVEVPSTITSNSTKYKLIGSSVGGDLILTVDRSAAGFASVSLNPNIRAVGTVLDNVDNPQGEMLNILNTLEEMSSRDVSQSLDTVIPVVDSGVLNVSNGSFNQFIGTSNARLADLFAQSRGSEETGISAGSEVLNGMEAWGRGFGEYIKQDARGFSNGYRATVWGTALGGDIPAFNNRVRLGLSGGYAQSDINSKDNSGKTDIDSYQGTFYGGYVDPQNPYYLNGSFSFAYNKYDGSRNIAVGAITRTAD